LKKKILILSNSDVGLYKFRKELIIELLKYFKIVVSMPYGQFSIYFRSIGCEVIDIPVDKRGNNIIKDFVLFVRYTKLIYKVFPSVILTYTIKPNIYGGLASIFLRKKYILNVTGLGSLSEKNGIISKLVFKFYKLVILKSNSCFFQNKQNQDFFSINPKKDNLYLIQGSGVNLTEYQFKLKANSDFFRFLFISRILKEKGIDNYLNAAIYFKKKGLNFEFHVVGECDDKYEKLLNELHDNRTIIYHGFQKSTYEFYVHTHCVVHPTFYPEGMSNVILEANSTGTPVITSNIPGCVDIIKDGVNGFILNDNKNFNELIEKLLMFTQMPINERTKMSLNAREIVENYFDRKIIIDSYINRIGQALKLSRST